MSKRSGRPNIPPRPQLIPEQMRAQFAGVPKVFNREQCAQFAVMLANQLAALLNNRTQLPWITASIDQRSDGFSLHVQVLSVDDSSDAVV